MKNELTKLGQRMLDTIEQGGLEMIQKCNLVWCYLDGKRNGCKTFSERVDQISNENKQ